AAPSTSPGTRSQVSLTPRALAPGALCPGAKRGVKGPPRSGGGGSGKPISDCCPLPPASANSGGRNLPPLRGGQRMKRGGKGPPRSGVGGGGEARADPSPPPPASGRAGGGDPPALAGAEGPRGR